MRPTPLFHTITFRIGKFPHNSLRTTSLIRYASMGLFFLSQGQHGPSQVPLATPQGHCKCPFHMSAQSIPGLLTSFTGTITRSGRFSCPVMGRASARHRIPPVAAGEDDAKGKSRRQGRQSRTPHLLHDIRWNWLGHILRMDERRTVRQVLLNCVKPTQESILGDLNGKDVNAAIAWAMDRIEWKKLRPSNSC